MKDWIFGQKQSRPQRVIYMPPATAETGPEGDVTARECSFCHQAGDDVGRLVAGSDVAICDRCLGLAQERLSSADIDDLAKHGHGVGDLYRYHFRNARRERQFLASVSFFATFGTVRLIVRSIQEGRGPFHNVSAGGRHIHHLVWGILTLLGVGYVWLIQIGTGTTPPRNWMRETAVLYGAGSALTLDEFALWLNLSDVYFTKEGRESVDAVILFGSLLSIGFWGRFFLHSLARLFIHKAKQAGGKA